MNLLPDLTVIIPNYNTKSLLKQCLDSIYTHTRGIQFEVICIDDGSSDGSPEMVESDFPGVILVRNKTPLQEQQPGAEDVARALCLLVE
jgi:glycosyltransferase involved in cell wall biosynthesis